MFIATSLDGFIARDDGSLDWLPPGGGEEHGYTAFMATVDAIVMGRNTFETVLTFDAWPFGKKLVVVLTTRPFDARPPRNAVLEFMEGHPRDVLDQLPDAAKALRHQAFVVSEVGFKSVIVPHGHCSTNKVADKLFLLKASISDGG